MSIKAGLAWLLAALIASATGVAAAVRHLRPDLAGAAAAVFALLLILVALSLNRPLWREPDKNSTAAAAIAGTRNATLIALAYGWGAVVLAAVYMLSGLVWQHGLQYAAGMGLIAILVALYARGLAKADSPLHMPAAQVAMLRLTILQALAAAAGVAFLFLAAKLKSSKGDWPANIVFLIGGVTICALSVIAALTQWHLGRQRAQTAKRKD